MTKPSVVAEILSAWLRSPLHLAVVVLVSVGTAFTLRQERSRADRYEPMALVAIALAAIGHSAAVAGAAYMARHQAELRPVALFRVAQGLLAGAVACGFVGLARLHVKHLQRRGRIFSICAVLTSACTAWIVQFFLVAMPPSVLDDPELELARVERAQAWWPGEFQGEVSARIHADGRLELEGASLPTGAPHEGLIAELARIAHAMPQRDGFPDNPLLLFVDRRAPVGALAELMSSCADPRVRLWKLPIVVEPVRIEGGRTSLGVLSIYRTLPLVRAIESGDPGEEELVRIEVRPASDGALNYTLEGQPCASLRALTTRLEQSFPDWGVIHAPAELPWGELSPLIDAMAAGGTTPCAFLTLEDPKEK